MVPVLLEKWIQSPSERPLHRGRLAAASGHGVTPPGPGVAPRGLELQTTHLVCLEVYSFQINFAESCLESLERDLAVDVLTAIFYRSDNSPAREVGESNR